MKTIDTKRLNFRKNTGIPLVLALAATLSGCATTAEQAALESQLQNEIAVLKQEQAALTAKTQAAEEAEQAALERTALADSRIAQLSGVDLLLPPSAKSGECYARIWAEPVYKTKEVEVLVREAGEKVHTVPAEYICSDETVLVKEASTKLVPVPAVYGTHEETIMTQEASQLWKTGLDKNDPPANVALLAAAKDHGIDLDAAVPGTCFHEHYRPAQFTTESKQVLKAEASENVDVSAAQFRMEQQTVLVKEASTKLIAVPAVYETIEESVLDVPAHTIWKKGTGPIQKIDEATGEIMCLVDVPATYKTITKRILKSPATTKTVEIPAQYKTIMVSRLAESAKASHTEIPAEYNTVSITKKVSEHSFVWHEIHNRDEPRKTRTGNKICLTETPAKYKTVTRRVVEIPATTKEINIPAKYQTEEVCKLVTPASETRTVIPAEYKTVSYQEIAQEGRMEWRPILCETNTTPDVIRKLQTSLQEKGYYDGPIDGIIGVLTIRGLNGYQQANNLPTDRYLNLETLKNLGII
ncbi:MAG: peptidoglycan-binding protein [Magnetococcales bacterium]|nr:peptidoglycan-binding protein [Magnetococcales bacterium]